MHKPRQPRLDACTKTLSSMRTRCKGQTPFFPWPEKKYRALRAQTVRGGSENYWRHFLGGLLMRITERKERKERKETFGREES